MSAEHYMEPGMKRLLLHKLGRESASDRFLWEVFDRHPYLLAAEGVRSSQDWSSRPIEEQAEIAEALVPRYTYRSTTTYRHLIGEDGIFSLQPFWVPCAWEIVQRLGIEPEYGSYKLVPTRGMTEVYSVLRNREWVSIWVDPLGNVFGHLGPLKGTVTP